MLLDDTNYTSWKAYIQQRLQSEGLLAITLGDEIMPEQDGTDEKEKKEFKKKSRLAFYLLIKSIDDSVIFSVSALNFENNPRELWTALKSKYFPEDLNEKIEAMRGLRLIKYKNNPHEFIEQIRASFGNIERAGFDFDETTWMVLFLSQLPRAVTDSILNHGDQDETSHSPNYSISSCAQLFEKLKLLSITSTPYFQNHTLNEKKKHGPSASGKYILSCTQCNKKGHDVDHCWVAHPERNPFFKGKDKGPALNGQTAAPVKNFYSGNQFNGPPAPTTHYKKPHNNISYHHTFARGIANKTRESEWNSFSKKSFKTNSDAEGDSRPHDPKQSTRDQSGWIETTEVSTTLTTHGAGWNDTTTNSVGPANETGWSDNVLNFETLPSPSGWGDPQD